MEVLDRFCLSDDIDTSEDRTFTAAAFTRTFTHLKPLADLTDEMQRDAIDSCRWICWAMANLVLLGHGSNMSLEGEEGDDVERYGSQTMPTHSSRQLSPSRSHAARRASAVVPGREGPAVLNHYNSSNFFAAAANRRLATVVSSTGVYFTLS